MQWRREKSLSCCLDAQIKASGLGKINLFPSSLRNSVDFTGHSDRSRSALDSFLREKPGLGSSFLRALFRKLREFTVERFRGIAGTVSSLVPKAGQMRAIVVAVVRKPGFGTMRMRLFKDLFACL